MLEFKLEDREKGIFAAYEGGKTVGRAFFKLDGYTVDIYRVEGCQDEPWVFEGLLRSVYNFGANNGAYIGVFSDENGFSLAESMNFVFDAKTYSNDIPSILTGSCGGCK